MDLEKFFDKVNQDTFMSKLGKRFKDKRLLILSRRHLKSDINQWMTASSEEGTLQGGMLSPLFR